MLKIHLAPHTPQTAQQQHQLPHQLQASKRPASNLPLFEARLFAMSKRSQDVQEGWKQVAEDSLKIANTTRKQELEQHELVRSNELAELRQYCSQLEEEKLNLEMKLEGKEQELRIQKQSLANLATAVVQQNKQIKDLTQHVHQLSTETRQQRLQNREQNVSFCTMDTDEDDIFDDRKYVLGLKEELSSPNEVLMGINLSSPSPVNYPTPSGKSTPYSQKSMGSSRSGRNSRNPRLTPPLQNHSVMYWQHNGVDFVTADDRSSPLLDVPQRARRRQAPSRPSFENFFKEEDILVKLEKARRDGEVRSISRQGGMTYHERGERTYYTPRYSMDTYAHENGPLTARRSYGRSRTVPVRTNNSFREHVQQRGRMGDYQCQEESGMLTGRRSLHRSRTAPGYCEEMHCEEEDYGRGCVPEIGDHFENLVAREGQFRRRTREEVEDVFWTSRIGRGDGFQTARRLQRNDHFQSERTVLAEQPDEINISDLNDRIAALELESMQGCSPLEFQE